MAAPSSAGRHGEVPCRGKRRQPKRRGPPLRLPPPPQTLTTAHGAATTGAAPPRAYRVRQRVGTPPSRAPFASRGSRPALARAGGGRTVPPRPAVRRLSSFSLLLCRLPLAPRGTPPLLIFFVVVRAVPPSPHRRCVVGAGGGAQAVVAAVPPPFDIPCAARGHCRRRQAARSPTRWRPDAPTAAPPTAVAVTRIQWAPSLPSLVRASVPAAGHPPHPLARVAPPEPRARPPRVNSRSAAPAPPWRSTCTAVAPDPHRGGTP